ncbi:MULTISPECIES: hypothetical protein [Halorussus]|uniref:hypothetical protein n=1 Tax=Halorussus TaxID=1070314 RepID=UPI00209F95F0|nr:hypothetical protein [Halorussus vallis]USZ75472.1 hypothetical protein NGM07_18825 [Halorussus vallis]
MTLTRRKLLARSALPGVLLSTSGCLSRGGPTVGFGWFDRAPNVNLSGNVSTDEPLIEGASLSTETEYPHHYSAVVSSGADAERIRWEYVRRELPPLVDELEATDFASEYLLFFGMRLPRTQQLRSGPSSLNDGTLYSEYRIEGPGGASSVLTINTNVQRVEGESPPDDVEFKVRF